MAIGYGESWDSFQEKSKTQVRNNWVLVYKLRGPLENRERLKYFRNVYCVITNHSKDQNMGTSHQTTN